MRFRHVYQSGGAGESSPAATPGRVLDSNFSNLEQNYFKKIYRAKTPSSQRPDATHLFFIS